MLSPRLKSIYRIFNWPRRFGFLLAFRKFHMLLRIFVGAAKFDAKYYQYSYPEVLNFHDEGAVTKNSPNLQNAPIGIHPAVRYVESGMDYGKIPCHPPQTHFDGDTVWDGSLSVALRFFSHRSGIVETVEPQEPMGCLRYSIIIPTFNRCDTVIAAIRSALEQSIKPHEVLICDDGGVDNTGEKIKDYFAQEVEQGLIRYFRTSRQGAAAARNFLLERATGELIAYLDSDVSWQKNHLESALGVFENDPHTQHVFISARPNPCDAPSDFILDRSWLLQRNFVDLNAYVHRRDLYEAWGGFDVKLTRLIDYDLILRYGRHAALKRISRDTVNYRLSEDSITRTQPLGPALARIRRSHRIERVALFLERRPIAIIGGAHQRDAISDVEGLLKQRYILTQFPCYESGASTGFQEWRRYSLLYFPAPQPSLWKTLSEATAPESLVIVVRCNVGTVNILVSGLQDGAINIENWDQITLLAPSRAESHNLRAAGVPRECIIMPPYGSLKKSTFFWTNDHINVEQHDEGG